MEGFNRVGLRWGVDPLPRAVLLRRIGSGQTMETRYVSEWMW